MKYPFIIFAISLFAIPSVLSAQIEKGNLKDTTGKVAHVLAYNEMQLINNYYPELNFEYSFEKTDWRPFNLKKDEYMLMRFTVNESYCYIRLCSDVLSENSNKCKPFRLSRKERYEFMYDNLIMDYVVKHIVPKQ